MAMQLMMYSGLILCLYVFLLLPWLSKGQGNGNPISLRTTPADEIFPIPHYYPPRYVRERIKTFIDYFFDDIDDKTEAEEILETIWNFSPVFGMLQTVAKMGRHQYAYAEYGDECTNDTGGDEATAYQAQLDAEQSMVSPQFIYSDDNFFKLDAWWEILGNTVDHIWERNQEVASKVCDFRRRGLLCLKEEDEDGETKLRCNCGYSQDGVRMVAKRGGLCGIVSGQECNYTSGSRLMTTVHKIEVYNSLGTTGGALKTCFGNSYCTGDPNDNNKTKCICWPLITSEMRAKRNALLNKTVEGERCDTISSERILKWEKWYIALTIVWVAIPLFLILGPHWDDIWTRILPGYFFYYLSKGKEGEKPKDLVADTNDVKMDADVKQFIMEHSVYVDVNDPEYFDKVDAVDERELDPFERFITVPHCTDKHFHFEWPAQDRLKVWF